jgi:XTP/dITP diphosphohydrolase
VKLLVATTNVGKVAEYQELLSGLPMQVAGLQDLGIGWDVAETGSTFEENALLKARAYAEASGVLTLSDDSGLCVDALGGAPGLYSARYARGDDRARIEKLLDALREVPLDQRGAKFVCVIALALPDGTAWTFEGECSGQIASQPSGANGFGYDPIFFMPEHGRTMAALPDEVKNTISHRARAMAKAKEWLSVYVDKT